MAVLGWATKRTLTFVGIVLLLFAGYLAVTVVVPVLTDVAQTDVKLQQVRAEQIKTEEELQAAKDEYAESIADRKEQTLDELNESLSRGVGELDEEVKKQEERIADLNEDLCNDWVQFWEGAAGIFDLPKPCAAAEEALRSTQVSLDKLKTQRTGAESQLETLLDPDLTTDEKLEKVGRNGGEFEDPLAESRIDTLEREVDTLRTEEENLQKAQDSWVWFVILQWRARWMLLVGIALALLLARPLVRVFNFFVAMPLVTRIAKPVRLSVGEAAARAQIVAGSVERSLFIRLAPGEVLSVRAQHLRDAQGTVKSQLLYDWSAPFISFAAGLNGLSRVTSGDSVAQMTISDPEESDSYMMRIDFQDHPGLVMHPKHVVGVVGTPRLKTRWHWGWHFLATGQARYILFTGSGSLLVQGISDIVAPIPSSEGSKMEQNLIMGFDSRLTVGIKRTENFISYYGGKEPLIDEVFRGPYPYFWQKTATDGTRNTIEKGFDAVFSAIGKVFGF